MRIKTVEGWAPDRDVVCGLSGPASYFVLVRDLSRALIRGVEVRVGSRDYV